MKNTPLFSKRQIQTARERAAGFSTRISIRRIRPVAGICTALFVLIVSFTLMVSCLEDLTKPRCFWKGWCRMNSGTTEDLHGVWGFNDEDVYAVGSNGTILHYDGAVWTQMESGTSTDLAGVWGCAPYNVVVTGDDGTILQYNGTTWSSMESGTTEPIGAIWVFNPNPSLEGFIAYAVGGGPPGTVLFFDGLKWEAVHTGASSEFTNLFGFKDPKSDFWGGIRVITVGKSGTAYFFDGENWIEMDTGTSEDLVAVFGESPNNLYAVSHNGTVLQNTKQYVDAGPFRSWLEAADLGGSGFSDMTARAYNDFFIVGNAGRIVNFDRDEFLEMPIHRTAKLNAVWSGTNDVFAVGDDGLIVRYSKPPVNRECPINVTASATPGDRPVISWKPKCPLAKIIVEDNTCFIVWFIAADGNLIDPGVEYGSTPANAIELRPTNVPLTVGELYRISLIRRDWDDELVVGTWNIIPVDSQSTAPATVTPANILSVEGHRIAAHCDHAFHMLQLRQILPGEPALFTFEGVTQVGDGSWRWIGDPAVREDLLDIRPVLITFLERDPYTGEIREVLYDNYRAANIGTNSSGIPNIFVWDVVNTD